MIDDEGEKRRILELIGRRCNPDDAGSLDEEIRKGIGRCLAIEFTIRRITGKQAIELVGRK